MPVMTAPNRSGEPLQLYVPPWIKAVLKGMAARALRTLSTEVLIALENYIKAAGLWAPPPEPDQEDRPRKKKVLLRADHTLTADVPASTR